MRESRDQSHALLRPGNRDVKPSLPAFHVQRTKAVQQPPVGVLSVSHAQDDGVALIALNALEILYKERLGSGLIKEPRELVFPLMESLPQGLVNSLGVLDAHRDHSEAFA